MVLETCRGTQKTYYKTIICALSSLITKIILRCTVRKTSKYNKIFGPLYLARVHFCSMSTIVRICVQQYLHSQQHGSAPDTLTSGHFNEQEHQFLKITSNERTNIMWLPITSICLSVCLSVCFSLSLSVSYWSHFFIRVTERFCYGAIVLQKLYFWSHM
jgi:hypothetical protein